MADSIGTATRRPGPFGPAWALLPKGQEVLSIPDDTHAWDAFDRMMDSGYSPLPVTKNGRVTGVFTWRCFGKRVADLRRANIKAIDLPVRDYMEPARFIDPETFIDTATDWSDVDYVLVGTDVQLLGILCVADVFGRLNDFAEAFVLIYEIEHEVRDLITEITGDAGLPPLLANMKMPENTRPLRVVTDFTFDQYRGLIRILIDERAPFFTEMPEFATIHRARFSFQMRMICNKVNWPTFERAFTSSREVIDEDFKQITELRNTVFHFKRSITPRDMDRLRRFRDSLRDGRELHRQNQTQANGATPAEAAAAR